MFYPIKKNIKILRKLIKNVSQKYIKGYYNVTNYPIQL